MKLWRLLLAYIKFWTPRIYFNICTLLNQKSIIMYDFFLKKMKVLILKDKPVYIIRHSSFSYFWCEERFCMTRRTYPQTDYVHPELCTIIGKKTQQPKYFIVVIFNVFLDDLGVIWLIVRNSRGGRDGPTAGKIIFYKYL